MIMEIILTKYHKMAKCQQNISSLGWIGWIELFKAKFT